MMPMSASPLLYASHVTFRLLSLYWLLPSACAQPPVTLN